ncbi:MAG: hypothetical protein PHP82_01620 [Candidatus ainarchaeum sp.]|nr:hypothetical protein [Candidatus ainarchaeum sp.]
MKKIVLCLFLLFLIFSLHSVFGKETNLIDEKPVIDDSIIEKNVCLVKEFVSVCCDLDNNKSKITLNKLSEKYSIFCIENDLQVISLEEFIISLNNIGLIIEKNVFGDDYVVGISFLSETKNKIGDLPENNVFFDDTNSLIILVIIILVILVISVFGSFFLIKNKQNVVLKEMDSVKEKMFALEKTYLKGKMDQDTYRKLMQKHQLRLTELELEISKMKKKSIKKNF